jgi:hypothetical protein
MISHCADRYRVSLIATILRWLSYTDCRGVLVSGRLAGRLHSVVAGEQRGSQDRRVFRTSVGPIEIPPLPLAATQDRLIDGRASVEHRPGVWFSETVREVAIFSEQYDFTVTLLLLEDRDRYMPIEPAEKDTFGRFARHG